ncbi:hypothetical protein K450DRAFT_260044 [Umbelopsis ramanniana AG]|uniref:6-phosphogluconolactonase n=1 Tax=Umbelopsis ramanniana AG TaxID=1314678 RepID=A0AAD5H8K7_UMBRA|nr:uncharacterized protein K450DRAFT_260044 [Umbelopsis ramanniana AG]KAI8575820.1 hypothetical protein K450DRAFT_260044 [Umbelopsis ramanniana AG]
MSPHTVFVFPSTDALSEGLNDYVQKLSRQAIASHGKFTVAVSGGSLPKLLSKNLAGNSAIDFSKWHVFFADERCVPLDHADSNYLEVKHQLLDKLNGKIPDANVHTINASMVSDAEKCAQDYEQQLKDVFGSDSTPEFDLLLLGMGPDGHTCSLFPGHPLLDENKRWVAPIFDSPKPPKERITLTFPVVNNAKEVAFVTAGDGKKDMVQMIQEQPELKLPCQRVMPKSGEVYWFIDEPAGQKLSKTQKYKL